ncbi:MAG: aminopeptidase [Halobacteria archaeon]|nr:aminopeptidase [Halobacteria archaeon]
MGTSMRDSARTAVEDCLDVREGETVLVVTDSERREIGRAIHDVASEITETVYAEIGVDERHGEEPLAPVTAAMRESDVVFVPTTRSLTHTEARKEACESGARVATLPSITREVMEGAMRADYYGIQERAEDLLGRLEGSETVRIESDLGTDLRLELGERDWHPDTGICHDPGCVTNLPAGEVYIAPVSGDGRLVVDGSMSSVGVVDEPIEMEFEDGRAVSISDDNLRETVDEAGDCGRHLAELGIGLNPEAELIGNVLQDEKALGTIHVAVGDDTGFGGDNDCGLHLDGVVTQPRVEVDGKSLELE